MSMRRFPVEREGGLPVYLQIRKRLFDSIASGELESGDAIPSEQEISGTLGVSRMTVRHAVKSLCDLGIAYSLRGKGTFVSPVKLEKNFRQVQSFSEEMNALGYAPGSQVLDFKAEPAPAKVAAALRVAEGTRILRLDRLRLASSEPMGVEHAHVVESLCPGLSKVFDGHGSLYKALWEHFGVQLVMADEVVEAALPGAREARLLHTSRNTPVFLFKRVSYAGSESSMRVVEYVESTYRGDRYKFSSRLTRARLKLAGLSV